MRNLLAPCVMVLLLAGCDDRAVEQYAAPKQPRPTLTDASQPVRAAAVTSPMTWTLPDGWTARADAGPMRAATFDAAEGAIEIAVTVFPGDVGGPLANVNRWRQQVNLEPVESLDAAALETSMIEGREAYTVRIPGLTAAGVGDGAQTWFVKMTGPAERVAAEDAAFVAFMQSLRWDREGVSGREGEGETAP